MKKLAVLFIAIVSTSVMSFANIDNTNAEAKETVAVKAVSINGSVTDILGESLVGAEITVKDSEVKAYTDFDGNFELKDLKPGKYSLIISYVAHTNSLVEIEVKENAETVEVTLKEE
jgi:hypothetical protein